MRPLLLTAPSAVLGLAGPEVAFAIGLGAAAAPVTPSTAAAPLAATAPTLREFTLTAEAD